MRHIIYSTGGRKFLTVLLCVGVSTVCLWYDKMDGPAYASIIIGVVGTFIAGDVYESVRRGSQWNGVELKGRASQPEEAGYQ